MQKMKRHDFSLTIIRVLDFVALVSLACYALFNLLFDKYAMYSSVVDLTVYIVTNCLVLTFCTICAILATYNHFVKKKLHWVEFGMAIATLVMTIVMIIIAKVGFDGTVDLMQKEIFMATSTVLLEVFATAITLAGTKIALVMSAKKDEKELKPQPEQK